ncbi:hypothetical protein DL93DRAFT_2165419 [Clavulina sp. PMI_390]|nr:hypothetical protein DL93DRAFT_2165419 [Clavulina sp. PMI_390]
MHYSALATPYILVLDFQRPADDDPSRSNTPHPFVSLFHHPGNLVQSASEDWSIVFDLCDYVARSESAAKDAARGIRRALKYGQATQQLMAARLWAVMLRNMTVSASPQSSSDPGRDVKEKEREPLFMRETSSKKFMETVEEVATTTKVEPVVRERLREILGGAVFEYTRTPQGGVDRKHPYVILWRKIKARSAPDEGVPLNPNDPMWNLPLPVPAPGSEPNAIPPHVRNRAEWSSSPTPSMLTTTTDRGQSGGVPYSQHGRDPSLSSLPPPSQSQSSLLDSPAEQQQQQQQREQRRLQKRNPKQPSQPQPQPQPQIQPIPQFPTDQRGSEYEFIDEREVRMARADAPAVPSKPPRDRERHRDRERDQKQERPVRSERERPPSSPNLPLSVPSIDVQIRQIYAECEAAQAKAQLLSDNVAQANVDEVEGGGSPTGPKGRNGGQSIIDEFYADCVRAQERVMNQIAWATAEAEKSRERLSTATPNANGKEQQPNGNRERGTVVTKEEEMLGALLGANQALTDAIQMRDDWQRAAIAAREERWVEERSRVETRIDRSQMFMAPDGTLYAPEQDPRNIAGSSRSPSPSPRALPRPMPPASDTGTLSSSYDSDSYHPQSNGHANPYTQPQSAAQQPAHRAPNRAQPYQQVESFYSGSIQPTGGMYYTNPQGNASQSLLTPQTPSNGASVTPTPSTPSQLAAPIPRINELPPTPQGHAQAQGATRAPGGGSGGGTMAQLSLAAPPSAPNSNLPTPTARTAPHGPRALGAGMHQHMYSRSRTPSPDLIGQQVRHQRSAESEDLTQSQLRDMRAPAVVAAGAVGMGLAAVGLASAMGAAPGSINHTTPLPPTPGEETVRLVSSRTRNPDSRGASGAVSPPPPGFPLNQAPQQTPALTQAQAYAYQQQQRQQTQAQTPPPNQQQFHHHQLPTPPQLAPGQVQPQSAHAAYIAGGVYGYQQQPQYQQPQQQYQPPSQQYQPTQWGEDDDLSHIPSEPLVPSAKALGKRRAKEKVYDPDAFDPDDIYKDPRQRAMYGLAPNDKPDSDSDDAADDEPYDEPGHAGHHHNIPKKPIVYAYDAAAEREKEWQRMEKERERAAAREREGRRASKGAPAVPAR